MTTRWDRVEQLFTSALILGPAARAVFLAEACRHNVTLREEVETLLRADAACGSGEFLRGPIRAAAHALVHDLPTLPARPPSSP